MRSDYTRYRGYARIFRIAIELADTSYGLSSMELSAKLGYEGERQRAGQKMAMRFIHSLEAEGVPVQERSDGRTIRYSIERKFLRRFM